MYSFKIFFVLCVVIIPLYGVTFYNLHKRDSVIVKKQCISHKDYRPPIHFPGRMK
jgi:hypothetical protein